MEKPTHSHVVAMPLPYMAIRAVQLLFAIILLGLSAFLTSNTHAGDDFPASYGLTLFTSLASILIIAYFVISSLAAPALYNMWAVVALDIFAVIFWLCSMATMAAFRASFTVPVLIFRRDFWVAGHRALQVQTACAILSAFEMVLFAAGLAFFIVKALNHKKNDSTTTNPEANGVTTATEPQPVMQQHQQAPPMQPQYQQPAMQQPQPQYPQQYPQQQVPYQQPPPQAYQQAPAAYPQQAVPQQHIPQQHIPQQQQAAEVEGQSPYQQPHYQAPYGAAPYGSVSPVSSPPPPQTH